MRSRSRNLLLAVLALVALLGAACGDDEETGTSSGDGGTSSESGGGGEDVTLSLVGFAVPEAANKAIQAKWSETPEGEGVEWETSYGASGDQSRAVVNGLTADYVHFSVESDVTRLVKEGLVADTWKDGPTKGVVSSSIVVIGVRDGNPKNIQGWDDLVKDGIGIVTPNPSSSGAARWNALAAYGQVIANGGTEAEAEAYLTKLFENVVALPGSGRDATTAFLGGTGDVLLAYENEAILAAQNDQGFEWIVPDTTLLIENPGAVLIDAHPKAQQFLDFVLSEPGQTELAEKGFRPVIDGIDVEVDGAKDPKNPFPTPKKLLTVANDFESWDALTKKFFDENDGIVTKIQNATGKTD